jgi:hypothetical protein
MPELGEQMNDLFLIAHKVRGKLAFDVAERVGSEWVIPSSGRRAYPWWTSSLTISGPVMGMVGVGIEAGPLHSYDDSGLAWFPDMPADAREYEPSP